MYRVADTGIGIPPDKIDSLFTEFKQTDATIAGEYGGTGLGLSITRKFVEMHGGRIWVESELGKGSTFLFEIPLRVASSMSAKTILYVEDNEMNRKIVRDLLKRTTYILIEAQRRRGRRREGARGPSRPDPHGHPVAENLRHRGHAPAARGSRDGRDADHRDHLVRALAATSKRPGRRARPPISRNPTARATYSA